MVSTAFKAIHQGVGIAFPDHALPKTANRSIDRRMVGLRFPDLVTLTGALPLDDPLIRVSGNPVLLVDADNQMSVPCC